MPIRDITRRWPELIRIAAPVMAEQTFVMMMGFVTSVLVASIGEHAVSAVAMVDSVSHLIIAFYAALTTGATIVVAQYVGRSDYNRAKSAAGQAFILSLSLSAVIVAAFVLFGDNIIDLMFAEAERDVKDSAYRFLGIIMYCYPFLAAVQTSFGILRGTGDTRTPMFISIVMNVINLALGLVLIPLYGVAGAAYALLAGRVAGFVICAWYLVFKTKTIRLDSFSIFKPNLPAAKNILFLGVPTSVEATLFQLGKIITMVYIVSMSTGAIAANAIGGTLLGMINVAGTGFSMGVMVLCGQKIGRGETGEIRPTAYSAVAVNMLFMAAVSLVLFVLFGPITRLYGISPETYGYLRLLMYSVFIVQIIFWPFSFIIPAALRAAGDVKFTMFASVVSMWVFRIALGYVFAIILGFGVLGVWMGMYADWMVRGILFNWRLMGKRWMGRGIK
jgi:putative MATE family efflux protein